MSVDSATKRYRLGLQILTLAKAALRESIADQAQPYLDEIVRKHLVTAIAVSVSEPDHYVVTAKSYAPHAIRLHVDLGNRFPALISATGRCFAAYSNLPRRVLKGKFEQLRWHNAPLFEEWERQVAEVRRLGYGIDDGNYLKGVCVVAAPILDKDGAFQHAIVAVFIKEGMTKANIQELANDVKTSASQVADGLRMSVKRGADRE